jgi:hypothetical protein
LLLDIFDHLYSSHFLGIIDNPADSLFTYASGQNWSTFYQPDFTPAFDPIFTSSELETQADMICGDDQFCRFDIAATSRTDIGLSTLLGGVEFEAIANISQPGLSVLR